MNEYMLLIKNLRRDSEARSGETEREFLRACESYIGALQGEGKLLAAQPLVREGVVVAKQASEWTESPLGEGEVQVGYYHVRASNLDEAVAIAKGNPEFEYSATARVEVRPLKTEEPETGFDYPTGA